VYGLIIAVIIAGKLTAPTQVPGSNAMAPKLSLFAAFAHLAGGIVGGLSGLAAGMCIGIVGDAGVRANALVLTSKDSEPCAIPAINQPQH